MAQFTCCSAFGVPLSFEQLSEADSNQETISLKDQTLGLVPPDNDDGDDVNDGPETVPPSMLAAAC